MAPHGAKISAESTWLRVGTPSGPFHRDTEHPLPGTCQVLVAEGKSTGAYVFTLPWLDVEHQSCSVGPWGARKGTQPKKAARVHTSAAVKRSHGAPPCQGLVRAVKPTVRVCEALQAGC